ncbi:MAG: hypothetical protein K9W44_05230 [Candidatus Lokiarchaeota archaeon]|nr:hypothetical protein [Candidatus Harpocratesius repetitus]
MTARIIAFPSSIEGLHSKLAEHFGHAHAFTLITFNSETNKVESIEIIKNAVHQQGKCMTPIMLLKNSKVDTIVIKQIGRRAFLGFSQMDIKVFQGISETVKNNFIAFTKGNLKLFNPPTFKMEDKFDAP